MRDLSTWVHRAPYISSLAILGSLFVGISNLILVLKQIPIDIWSPTLITQVTLAVILIVASLSAFYARQNKRISMEIKSLPWLILGSVITLIIYWIRLEETVTTYATLINVTVCYALWVRMRELSALQKAWKKVKKIQKKNQEEEDFNQVLEEDLSILTDEM